MSETPNFRGADMQMLGHVAAFRERGQTEPHPDCSWCKDAAERGLWDAPLRRYRVTFWYEAEVEVSALDGISARHRASPRAEPAMVDSEAVDLEASEAAGRGDWQPAIDAYFRDELGREGT
jgi:hypothetical protein